MFLEPITGKDFFGRTDQRKILKERARSFKSGFRQNIAILGRPFVGKTSLVCNFLPELLAEQIIPVYVQARQLEPFGFFCHRFIGSLLYNYLKSKSAKPKKDELHRLIKYCKKSLPKVFDAIKRIEDCIVRENFDTAYDILLDLPKLLESDANVLSSVIIEEFDGLAGYKLNQPFSVLGKKIMAQRNTFYIVTSSRASHAKQIVSEKLHLLFGNFEIIELREFDFITSKNFLLSRLGDFSPTEKTLRFLIDLTDGHPFYLDVISTKVSELILQHKKRKITTVLLQRVLEEVLFNPNGKIYQHFVNIIYRHCSSRNGLDILSVLVSLSDGNYKLQRLADSLNTPCRALSDVISDLEMAGLVSKVGVFNKIDDLLFRFWLKSVYHKNRMDFTADPSYRQKAFTAHFKKFSMDFAKASREDLYEKIVGLFKEFKDDIVQLDQKRYRLPNFSDVAIRVMGESGPYIVCHSKGKNWICQIREREVSEKHIADFLKDAKMGKYKFHHKVLIVIKGMDENAKLLAKSSNIWTWNLKTLNLLLDLYGKHKVIKL